MPQIAARDEKHIPADVPDGPLGRPGVAVWDGRTFRGRMSRVASDVAKESSVDADILDSPGGGVDTEFVTLEQFAQAVAVDEVHWWCRREWLLSWRPR